MPTRLFDADIPRPIIQFLHATAKDFLKRPSTWVMQERVVDQSGFDVNVALLRASMYKIHSMIANNSSLPEWTRAVQMAIDYARKAEKSTGQAQTGLLDDLDMTFGGVMRYQSLSNDRLGHFRTPVHWSATLKHKIDEDFCDYCPDSFLACAVMSGLALFVMSKGSEITTRRAMEKKSLLIYATIASQRHANIYPSASMVQLLLENGADPNEKSATVSSETSIGSPLSGMTPWHLVLRYLYLEYHELEYDAKREDLWLQICLLFLHHGADPHIRVETYPTSETLSPDHVSISRDMHTDSSDLGLKDVVLRVFPELRLKGSETFLKFRILLKQKNLDFYRAP